MIHRVRRAFQKSNKRIVMDLNPLAELLDQDQVTQGQSVESFTQGLDAVTSNAASQIVSILLANPNEAIRERRSATLGFESRLTDVWAPALDLFDLFQALVTDFGADLNRRYREQAATRQDLVFEALTRLHGRACMTASEVGALLRSGHATGANARWRTLHELAVVALFISERGQELARRYLDHQVVDMYRSARQFQEFVGTLGQDPLHDEELQTLVEDHNRLVAHYGPAFKGDYGWAAEAVGMDRPTFRDIAAAIRLDHWSPYVRMASRGIHAGSRGGYFDLGLPPELEAIPAGPSHFGLADPGGNSMISLLQATVPLIVHGLNTYCARGSDFVAGLLLLAQLKTLDQLAHLGAETFGEIQTLKEEVPPELTGFPPVLQLELDG